MKCIKRMVDRFKEFKKAPEEKIKSVEVQSTQKPFWEYKTICPYVGSPLNDNEANELGKDAWELVSVYEYSNNHIAATFKRLTYGN
jgi:hypothetical protein